MSDSKNTVLTLHHDVELFRAALNYTAAETGFAQALIEKDYYCSVVLQYLMNHGNTDLVFKGGTCLAKVHIGFYRLSEDLDFVIPVPENISRGERRERAENARMAIETVEEDLQGLRIVAKWKGANSSRQYMANVGYESLLRKDSEVIKIEIGLREPLLLSAVEGKAQTLLLDPISGEPMIASFSVASITEREAFAEKFRAALSRREVAIRDFYDIDYAVQKKGLAADDSEFVALVRQKMAVTGNDSLDVSDDRLSELDRQLEAQLRPVLKDEDYSGFDLARAIDRVRAMAQTLA